MMSFFMKHFLADLIMVNVLDRHDCQVCHTELSEKFIQVFVFSSNSRSEFDSGT